MTRGLLIALGLTLLSGAGGASEARSVVSPQRPESPAVGVHDGATAGPQTALTARRVWRGVTFAPAPHGETVATAAAEQPVTIALVPPPTVRCPTRIFAIDPRIDPDFVRPHPKDAHYTMRSVAPPICR